MKQCKRPLFTIGNLPSSYLLSMTYEEQVMWLGNFLQETIIPALEKLEADLNIIDPDKIQEEINDMKLYIANMQEEINNQFSELETNLTAKVDYEIRENYKNIVDYLNYELESINRKIDNIAIDNIMIRNPVTGNIDNIQKVIDDIYYGTTNGITASAFDDKQLTANAFDLLNITAYEFDINSANLL